MPRFANIYNEVGLEHRLRSAGDAAKGRHTLDLKALWKLFQLTKPYAFRRNALFILTFLRAIQLPTLAWLVGAVIKGPITHQDVRGTLLGAAAFVALAIFTQWCFSWRIRLAMWLGEDIVHDLRERLYRHLQQMPASFYNKNKLGRLFSLYTSDVEAVRRGIQDVFFVTVVNGGQMVVSAGIMAFYDKVLFGVVLLLLPLIYWLNMYFRDQLREQSHRVQETLSRVYVNLAESINGIRVSQSFVRHETNAGFFRGLATEHSESNLNVARTSSIYLPLLELNTQIFMAVLLLVGGWRVLHPATGLSVGDLITFFFLTNLVFTPLQALSNQYSIALAAIVGAERVFGMLDRAPEWRDPPEADALPDPRRGKADAGPSGARVEFRDVHFGYEPDKPVLHGISFRAEAGQTVALVGHTGSGKSTIINLLGKFYLASRGDIFIDGHEARTITAPSLHGQMSFVMQSNFLFTGTIFDNIRFGRPSATDDEVRAVCERLGCRDLIEALPQGFATKVGERGTGISLGQRQLICFARALIADPRILVLDEATSAIDAMTEARLQSAVATLLLGRTSFVVAHRLSTIVRADQILVLDHGRLVEQGRHAALVEQGGVYARLYRQFASVNEE